MDRPSDRTALLLGFAAIAGGVAVLLVAAGVVAVDPTTVHAPRWVLGACGAVFALGGLAVIVPEGSPVGSAAAGTLVLAFGLVGGWVALFGEAEGFSGGLAFVPRAVNVAIARGLFGAGALLCFALFAWGVRQTVRRTLDEPPAGRSRR